MLRYMIKTTGEVKDGYKPGQFAPKPIQSGWENPVAFNQEKSY